MTNRPTPSGFSLVELSIVLVILGLLTGGILGGQALIRAAELRAVTTEYDRWVTATRTFQDKYFALPGDMTNATAFWGKDAASCNGQTGAAATPGTCNGDGDGIADSPAAASQTGEVFRFWQHLALAGLLEGTFAGTAGPNGNNHSQLGANVPRSKLSNAGWSAFYTANYGGDAASYAIDYGNYFRFGTPTPNTFTTDPALKPEEAWNIDTKMDDGRPGYGKVSAVFWNNQCATGGAAATDLANSVYFLSNTAVACALSFTKLF